MKRFDTAASNRWMHYVIALVAGALIPIPAFAGLMAMLDHRGAMPAPLISNNLCADEKLAFMRKNRPSNVNLLVVGSSLAMRHFNSPEAIRFDPKLRPYNAGLCAMNLWRDEQVIKWLTYRLPDVRQVLLVVAPLDFGDCRHNARPTLDMYNADLYVFGNSSRLSFYLKSFNATTLFFNTIDLRRRRTDKTWFDSVVIDEFGDAPAQPRGDRPEWYQKATLDEQCFATLRETARMLDARGIQFAVAESPMNPRWREEFDQSGELTLLMRRRIQQALTGTHAVLIENRNSFSAADFYDAIHLRWSSTPRFTRSVLSQWEALDGVTSRHSG